ncbi:F-box protein PP2-B11 [Abeliophyllum distichum]|uniref:F-box protein PP2-B11 n=1 Tax=Abeliophyllum distichum TaxID=126358 RepID=A0ABD1TG12_9LAMI
MSGEHLIHVTQNTTPEKHGIFQLYGEKTPKYWKWTTLDDNSRSEVAELVDVCWLDIKGIIDIKKLLIKTNYVVFLVFKLKEDSYGLKKANSSVRFLNGKTEGESTVFIDKKKVPGERGRFPQPRTHGWMEIKLGEFFNNLGEDGDVEFRLFETEN